MNAQHPLATYTAIPRLSPNSAVPAIQVAIPILLVEDSPADALLAKRALFEAVPKAHISHLPDGEQLLSYLAHTDLSGHARVLMLLDLKTPRVNGFEVIRRIRENPTFNHIYTVVFSSSNLGENVEQALALGAQDYYVKPIDFVKFRQAIKDVVQQFIQLEQPQTPSEPLG